MLRRAAPILVAALALAQLASAAAPPTAVFGLRGVGNPTRGYFIYPIAPGAVRQGAVLVTNDGKATGTVKLYTADGTTGATTGTVYLADKAPQRAGAWVKLAASTLTLRPGVQRRVGFTVHVPANASPGQWVAGIVAETGRVEKGQKSKQKASVQIRIRNLTIIAVQVNVPGPLLAKFKIGKVKTGGSHGFQQVIVRIANKGNVLSKPTGAVTILTAAGQRVETIPFRMDTFLPQTTIDYPVLLKRALPAGDYRAEVSLHFAGAGAGGAQTVSATPTFSVSKEAVKQVFTSTSPTQLPPGGASSSSSGSSTPWAVIAAIVGGALLLALLVVILLLLRRRHTPSPPAAPAVTAEPVSEPVPPPAAAEPIAAPAPASAREAHPGMPHRWEVAYDRGALGNDGIWRFPHRCRDCGLEVLAQDFPDATARAGRPA